MKKISIVLVMLSVVLAACANGQDPNEMDRPFIGGNAAINLYLQNGMPPPNVYDGGEQPFPIGVVLENIGESDIGPGTDNDFFEIRLEGLLPNTFGISEDELVKRPDLMIRGSRKNFDGTVLPGEPHNSIFGPLTFQPELQGNQERSFRVVACYDYKNYATTSLCMKDDVLENVQDSTICTLSGPRSVFNSGGPIHVTGVTQNPMDANKVQLILSFEHVGTGEFFGREEGETCDSNVRNTNKYNVDVDLSIDDPNAEIVCHRLGGGSSGRITMFQGAAQDLTCIVEGGQTSARIYQETLNIEMSYRYSEFIEDAFIVQSVPRSD